jgi:hypothetical protein
MLPPALTASLDGGRDVLERAGSRQSANRGRVNSVGPRHIVRLDQCASCCPESCTTRMPYRRVMRAAGQRAIAAR